MNLTADQYHADATGDDRPSLSSSLIHTLVTRSPAHAWIQHPKLNPDWRRHEDDRFDVGNAAHSLFLQGEDRLVTVFADSWRTNDAKAQRDDARAAGMIPMLMTQVDEVRKMVAAIRDQVDDLDAAPGLFIDGQPEVSATWEERDVLCRARFDWLHDDLTTIDDLKTTKASAHPEAYARALYGSGGDIQAAFYLRGLRALAEAKGLPFRVGTWRWVVVETSPPFALSVLEPSPTLLALADEKIDVALATWRECLATNIWPGYPPRIATAWPPAYEQTRWEERVAFDQGANL